MPTEVAYIDENSFLNKTEKETARKSLESLLEILLELDRNGTPVSMSCDYFSMVVGYEQISFYDILFIDSTLLDISPEVTRQLTTILARCTNINVPPNNNCQINLNSVLSKVESGIYVDVSIQHDEGQYSAVIFPNEEGIFGPATIILKGKTVPCFLISNSSNITHFYRNAILELNYRGEDLYSATKRAFPRIVFHKQTRVEDLKIDLNIHFETVLCHLSFLNDEYESVGKECAWDAFKMQATSIAKGIDFSDESSNTKKDTKKMALRNRDFGTEEVPCKVCCSYHTKITKTEGRIHFFPSHKKFPGKILVGIFHKHLPI